MTALRTRPIRARPTACFAALAGACAWLAVTHAAAQWPAGRSSNGAQQGEAAAGAAAVPQSAPLQPSDSPQRAGGLEPKPVRPAPPRLELAADPIADGALILGAAGFAGVLDLINSTGEIRPQQISPTFDRSQLLGIDRAAVQQHDLDQNADLFSTISLVAAAGYAVIDPIWTGLRESHLQAGLVDGMLYAEAIAITWGLTNLAKLAVRRPRPRAYYEFEQHRDDPDYSNSETDSALSFFSGHVSVVSTIAATATYLAFVRSPDTPRPWITLVLGTALSTFVAIERVRARAHFTTDVIAGGLTGIGVGVLVVQLHRSEDLEQRRIWLGFAPAAREGGGAVAFGYAF